MEQDENMLQEVASDVDIRAAKTVADAVDLWLERRGGGTFHYRDDIWQGLAKIAPETFAVTENRKTPWFTIIRDLNGDSRFEKVRRGYYRLARHSETSSSVVAGESGHRTLHGRVREKLNEYLESTNAWREHVDDERLLGRQRANFLERFRPQRLRCEPPPK